MVQLKGIDVSDARGVIDWDQVKPHIDFAMIRCGYGSNMTVQDDKQFIRNATECERLGIPYGVYLYSYALNVQDAMSEAQHILRLIQGRKIAYPICLDMEDADGYKQRKGMPTNQMLVDICNIVLSTVEGQGHYVSLYASLSWLNNQLNDSKLDRYDKWVAQWNSHCDYQKYYSLWQYSDQGNIPGIGLVDLDYSFKDFAGTAAPAAPQPVPATPVPVGTAIVPYPGHFIKVGSRGIDVQRIQRAVGVNPDGIFGPQTTAAVKAYQGRHHLIQDGIVGPQTWNTLF
jgi:GH25 family lysozyme M1 (1,4-beta-N-acetylmuramidase)